MDKTDKIFVLSNDYYKKEYGKLNDFANGCVDEAATVSSGYT